MTTYPLIDLHRHLEGSIRSSTILDIAVRDGHPFAQEARPRDLLVVGGPLGGLLPYLAKVDDQIGVLGRLDDWRRVGREAVEDAFNDGLDRVELRFSPYFIKGQTGLAPEAVMDAVADGVREGQRVTRLDVGLIATILRDLGPEAAQEQVTTFLTRPDMWCGVDLAGNEAGYAAELFVPAFTKARDAGMRITVHAGEAAGADSVRAAVQHLGAERIGHGVRSAEDPRLLELLADRGVTLEVALTSNTQTGAAPSYREHQIHALLAAGVAVTLNTDNPRASDVTLSQEFRTARTEVGLSEDQLKAIGEHSVQAAFN